MMMRKRRTLTRCFPPGSQEKACNDGNKTVQDALAGDQVAGGEMGRRKNVRHLPVQEPLIEAVGRSGKL